MDLESSDEFLGGMGGLQTMGILNALRTGDPTVDMLLAMCLPFVIRLLFDFIRSLEDITSLQYWISLFRKQEKKAHRCISHRTTKTTWGDNVSLDSDSQNTVLMKAIQLYLHSVLKLQFSDANVNLTSTEDRNSNVKDYGNGNDCDYDNDDRSSSENTSKRTVVGALSKYKIVRSPVNDEWTDLGKFGEKESTVKLMICRDQGGDNDRGQEKAPPKENKLEYHLKSDNAASIDAFIEKAYKWYLGELAKMEDNSRYLFELRTNPSSSRGNGDSDNEGDASTSSLVYKRYRLSDEKTFDSLFFQEKELLLRLIDHFQDKTGKYAIKGYPHKIGILMHGAPGTGKTSLIKALAHYTGRSIVNVPLARISTNAELMSIFFDRKFNIEGSSVPVNLGFKDVIFVMEDVDAASKIVKRRDGKKTADVVQTEIFDFPTPTPLWHMLLQSNNSDCHELVEKLMEKSERLKAEAQKPCVLRAITERMAAFPGLGLVNHSGEDPVLQKISDEAINAAKCLDEKLSSVDTFLGPFAASIKRNIEAGTEIDSSIEDMLLGEYTPTFPSVSLFSQAGQQVSYTRYDQENEIHTIPGGGLEPASPTSSTNGDTKKPYGPSFSTKVGMDDLNLQGLLNVLDGVVDSPGRIVIMTTNHPEQLDPALIRPGRIDKKLHLGSMAAPDVIDLLEHFFQIELTENERARVIAVFDGSSWINNNNNSTLSAKKSCLNLTPAQLEQLIAEHDDVEGMICALERKANPLVPLSNSLNPRTKSILAYGI